MANPVLQESGIASPQSIYELSTTQEHPIGTKGTLVGGRVFYYARHTANATTAAGKVHAAAAGASAFEDLAVGTPGAGATVVPSVVATSAITSGNAFQYLAVVDGGGEGRMYRIRNHGTGTGSPTISVELFDGLEEAFTASTQVSLIKDIYADVVIAPSDGADVPAGIAHVDMVDSSSTARYVWLQTYGPCTAWVNGTPAEGTPLVVGDANGNLTTADQTATGTMNSTVNAGRVVAFQLGIDGTDDEVQVVDLRIRA